MRVLVIDNYDSFVYTLDGYLQELGAETDVVRNDVVAAYKQQFATQQTAGFELSDLEADGGAAGRATAKYRVRYEGRGDTTGTMTWTVINERGRPRITQIAFVPD